jgi:Domain of unknown function (DUF4389)
MRAIQGDCSRGGAVSTFTYDVGYEEDRNRLTVAFRLILAIPHLIIAQVWTYFAEILAVVQWFIILFTGKRNEGIWNLQKSWLSYYCRVLGYVALLFDPYPAFASDTGPEPVTNAISLDESANRLTCALRLIWIIPAVIIGALLAIASEVLLIISWFAIVITGKQPRGMWDFILKTTRFALQCYAYGMLMTDVYPKFGEGAMAAGYSASPPPPPPPTSFVPPPPPPPM